MPRASLRLALHVKNRIIFIRLSAIGTGEMCQRLVEPVAPAQMSSMVWRSCHYGVRAHGYCYHHRPKIDTQRLSRNKSQCFCQTASKKRVFFDDSETCLVPSFPDGAQDHGTPRCWEGRCLCFLVNYPQRSDDHQGQDREQSLHLVLKSGGEGGKDLGSSK